MRSAHGVSTWALLVAVLFIFAGAPASAVTFTTDTSIANGDVTYDGQPIVVSGCTVTIDGAHAFTALTVTNNGIVTHTANAHGCVLTISGNVDIDAGSKIDVSGRGFPGQNGPGAGASSGNSGWGGGGGGYGGNGGGGRYGAAGGGAYGSIPAPVDFGSGGGSGSGNAGGAGGGRIRLAVGGTLSLDGSLLANGSNGNPTYGGGGSGGSIHVTTLFFDGAGVISAVGGNGGSNGGGGGAGGRIALLYNNISYTGSKTAQGGSAGSVAGHGGAGTIFTRSGASGTLRVDNANQPSARTPLNPAFWNGEPAFNLTITNAAVGVVDTAVTLAGLTMTNAGILTHSTGGAISLDVTVTGNVSIDTSSSIDVKGCGFGPSAGPAPGASTGNSGWGGGGGGHGGVGGIGREGQVGGGAYDQAPLPEQCGSGGGSGSGDAGGYGGGLVHLVVAGTLSLDGAITANGNNGNPTYGGGGAGGGIFVTALFLEGAGTISVIGGNGGSNGGGGGAGGRIALLYGTTTSFTGTVAAQGGAAGAAAGHGGAGTIYTKANADAHGAMRVDNAGLVNALTTLDPAFWTDIDPFDLVIVNAAIAVADVPIIVAGLQVSDNATLTHTAGGTPSLHVTVDGNALIGATGAINVSGKGFPQQSGPGAGATTGNSGWGGGGAGHGGVGGIGREGQAGGPAYDSVPAPADFGSGGGAGSGNAGGAGGGLARLIVSGTFTINGLLAANGNNGTGTYGGGGSGGSLYVTTGTLTGTGGISVIGGNGGTNGGGGGAGGRIALVYGTKTFTGTMTAQGGSAGSVAGHGGAGTIYTKLTTAPRGAVRVDNATLASARTPLNPAFWPGEPAFDLTIINNAVAVADWAITLNSLLVDGAANLTHSAGATPFIDIVVNTNATVTNGSFINVSGCGFPTQTGPGAGTSSGNSGWGGGGGGYGGVGGHGRNGDTPGGWAYGSVGAPAEFGSGGGHGSGEAGGAGGGLARLRVTGTLTMNGMLLANGSPGTGTYGGGGSGGGLNVTTGTLTGVGVISAIGGNGGNNGGGGGAGGRIAVIYTTNTFTGSITAHGGSAGDIAGHGGAGTIYTKVKTAAHGAVRVDNAGLASARTPLNPTFWSGVPDFDLTLINDAVGLADWPISLANLLIDADAVLTHSGAATASMQVTVAGDATVTTDGLINVSDRGYSPTTGPGAGTTSGNSGWGGGGAGHGGIGGTGRYGGGVGGTAYDSVPAPANFGSGGGHGSGQSGGAGGGLARLIVNGIFTVDGLLAANGGNGADSYGGGGSGGSLYVTADTLTGGGTISAIGGSGGATGGGGGAGGRIAIVYAGETFTGVMTARGGTAGSNAGHGGAGTIYMKATAAAQGTALVDNATLTGALTPLNPAFWTGEPAFNLAVMNNAIGVTDWAITLANLNVDDNARLTHSAGGANSLYVTVTGNALIGAAGTIDVSGKGFPTQNGPGAGASTGNSGWGGGGGGHGGVGGVGRSGAAGGGEYDEVTAPVQAGSGGGYGSGDAGGNGGGIERLIVNGTLTVDGMLLANGNAGNPTYGGGAAGGSIYLTVGTLDGSGHIRAMGGNGGDNGGGGGGGGRIAIYCATYRYTGQYNVDGGAGGSAAGDGGVGTIYFGGDRLPDLMIRHQGEVDFIGDDIYQNLTAQTKSKTVLAGQTAVFDVLLQSDSAAPDKFVVTGPVTGGGWTVEYLDASGTPLPINPTTGWTTPTDLLTGDTIPITVRVTAGAGLPDTAMLNVVVNARSFYHPDEFDEVQARVLVNTAPVAVDDAYTGAAGTPMHVAVPGVLDNDTDEDGDPLTAVKDSDPANGTLTLNTDGSFTYTPNAGFDGDDAFTYHANDGLADSNTATVSLTITSTNVAPQAQDGTLTTNEDTATNGTLVATDGNGDALVYSIVANGSKGSAVITNTTTGAYTYTPTANANGGDSFTFRAYDGVLYSNVATVMVTITPVNDAPVAQNGTLTTDEDTAANGTLNASDIDGDALTFAVVTNGAKGTAVITNTATGAYSYTPTANASGSDSFTFRVNDDTVDSNTATVTVTLNAVNDAPVANDGTLTTDEDTAANGTLTASDIDGDALTFAIVTNGAKGMAVITNIATGAYTFTPNAGETGMDTFTFKVNDGTVDSNTATITVMINAAANVAPEAVNGTLTTNEDTAANGTLVATDANNDPLTFSIVTNGAKGTAVITNSATGAYTYTPNANANGGDSFTFMANDGVLDSNIATITVTITPVNDTPVAQDGTLITDEDNAANGTLSASDIDGDALTYSIVTNGAKGSAVITNTATGAYTYTPTANANGGDSFAFRVNDGTVNSNTAMVTVTINAVNDAPVAQDGTLTTGIDTPADSTLHAADVDGDALTFAIGDSGTLGTAVITDAATGAYTYTPNPGASGIDTFTFTANDGTVDSNEATVTVTITSGQPGVTVRLLNSQGNGMAGGVVSYYEGGWQAFGITGADGAVSLALLPGTYAFRMAYCGGILVQEQAITGGEEVIFRTTPVTIELRNSAGALIDLGMAQYYSGADGWQFIGNTTGGQVQTELLPASHLIGMTHVNMRLQKHQHVGANPVVVFQLSPVTVKLLDSQGNGIAGGVVSFYAGGWRSFGVTGADGTVTGDLAVGAYTFRMEYAGGSCVRGQYIAGAMEVIFRTTPVTIELRNSAGALIDPGVAQYLVGAGWQLIGHTVGGQVSTELLPANHCFAMTYTNMRLQKHQHVGNNPVVVFQLSPVTVKLLDHQGNGIAGGIVSYYLGGWRIVGNTGADGTITVDVAPGAYTFRVAYAGGSSSQTLNITGAAEVIFRAGQVHSTSNTCSHYYAAGWRAFTQDMQLLPGGYLFRFTTGSPVQETFAITSGVVNTIR